jgi:hypothetical protein
MKLRIARKVSQYALLAGTRADTAKRARERLTRRILSHHRRIRSGRAWSPSAEKRDPLCCCDHRKRDHHAIDRTGRLWCSVMVPDAGSCGDLGRSCSCPGFAPRNKP